MLRPHPLPPAPSLQPSTSVLEEMYVYVEVMPGMFDILVILANCTALRCVGASSLPSFDLEFLNAIAHAHVRRLVVTEGAVTDLDTQLVHMCDLRELVLHNGCGLTDQAFTVFAQHNPQLKFISIHGSGDAHAARATCAVGAVSPAEFRGLSVCGGMRHSPPVCKNDVC